MPPPDEMTEDAKARWKARRTLQKNIYRAGHLIAPDGSWWVRDGEVCRGYHDAWIDDPVVATSAAPWEPAEWTRILAAWEDRRWTEWKQKAEIGWLNRCPFADPASAPKRPTREDIAPGWRPCNIVSGCWIDPLGNAWGASPDGGWTLILGAPETDGLNAPHTEATPTWDEYEQAAVWLALHTADRDRRVAIKREAPAIASRLSRWIADDDRCYVYQQLRIGKSWGGVALGRAGSPCFVLARKGPQGRNDAGDLILKAVAVIVPDGSGWACYAGGPVPDEEALAGLSLAIMEAATPVGPFEARPDLKIINDRGVWFLRVEA